MRAWFKRARLFASCSLMETFGRKITSTRLRIFTASKCCRDMTKVGNASVLKIPKGCHTKTIRGYGREWTMVAVPWANRAVGALRKNDVAVVDLDMGVILFRSCMPADAVKIAIVHELLHISFPSIKETEMHAADGPFVALCIAAGVNFDGLMEGYE